MRLPLPPVVSSQFAGASVQYDVPLAPLTTLRIGPVARRLITCDTTEKVVNVLRNSKDSVVLEVEFTLDAGGRSAPLRYGELTTALAAEPGAQVDPARVREAVLTLRRRKGMVLDDADHDTWSVGSFFTNPIV